MTAPKQFYCERCDLRMTGKQAEKHTHPAPIQDTGDLDIKEQLAAIEHERWSDWQKWMHSKGVWIERNGQQYLCFSKGYITHLESQIDTPYDLLTLYEQASDMEQVDRYWPLIQHSYIRKDAEHLLRPGRGTTTRCSCGESFGVSSDAQQHQQWHLAQQISLSGYIRKSDVLAIIGADEPIDGPTHSSILYRNQLRAQQRQAFIKEFGGEDE